MPGLCKEESSMASDNQPRELQINEKPLFPESLSETDQLEVRLDDGTVIRAVVDGSRIVGYTAVDYAGKSIPVFRISMKDGSPPAIVTASGPIRCYYCICNPGCQCWPEPCPLV
jgi:hypothetical protein